MSTDKDMKKRMQIVNAIADLRTQINMVEKYCEDLFEDAVKAAKQGYDDFADELLETIAYFRDFLYDLKMIELRIQNAAKSANVFEALGDLPKIVKVCSGIVLKVPDFRSLGRGMADLDAKFQKMRSDLKQIATSKKSSNPDLLAKLYGDTTNHDKKIQKSVNDLKAALVGRLTTDGTHPNVNAGAAAIVTAPLATAANTGAGPDVGAGNVDDILDRLDDEKKGG